MSVTQPSINVPRAAKRLPDRTTAGRAGRRRASPARCSATTRASSPARSTGIKTDSSLSTLTGRGGHELGDARRARRLRCSPAASPTASDASTPVLIAGLLFIVGALLQALAPGIALLVVGRFVVGFGVGVASVAAPLYAAEMAPARIAAGSSRPTSSPSPSASSSPTSSTTALPAATHWRLMLGVSAVPGFLLILVMLADARDRRAG